MEQDRSLQEGNHKMMNPGYLTYGLFALTCLALLTLPFLPAFHEWLRPSDVAALPISPNYTSQTDYFAKRLRADVAAKTGQGLSTGYEEFNYVSASVEDMNWLGADKRLISSASINSAAPIRSTQPLYVTGDIQSAAGSYFSSLYAAGNIVLGDQSEVRDWAHAMGTLTLGKRSIALRRISAGVSIELDQGAWFERLDAPLLQFGPVGPYKPELNSVTQTEGSFSDLPNAIRQTPMLYLIRGDCALPGDTIYRGSLIVTGFLTIGARTTVTGDIKAREGASIGPWSSVQGAITCEKRIYVFKGARAMGPVVSETDVLVGANAVIGLPDSPTTITALNIILESGVVVHGTVWAREIGMVKAA